MGIGSSPIIGPRDDLQLPELLKTALTLVVILGVIYLFLSISSRKNPITKQQQHAEQFVKAPFIRIDPNDFVPKQTFSPPGWLWFLSGIAVGWAIRFIASLFGYFR